MSLPQWTENSARDPEVAGGDTDSDRGGVDWRAVREIYEGDTTVSVRALVARFGTTKYFIQRHIETEGWTPRRETKRGFSRSGLIRRLLEAIDRQMHRIETEDIPDDKRTAMIASMSRTLAKVLQMEQDRRRGSKAGKSKEVSAEMAALREKIAKRIEQLNQG